MTNREQIFLDLEKDTWLGRLYCKIPLFELAKALEFIQKNEQLGHIPFEEAVNRMFLDQEKPKYWKEITELLICANSRAFRTEKGGPMKNLLIVWFVACMFSVLAHAEPLTAQQLNDMSPELKDFIEQICTSKTSYGYNKMRAEQERKVVGEHDGQVIYQFSAQYPEFVRVMTISKDKLSSLESSWQKKMHGPFNYEKCPLKWR